MGVSKAEVNLKRLLRAQGNQTNEAKLVHYVATMRSLLAELTGDPAHQELATIPASMAREYAQQIELVAQKVRGRSALPALATDAELVEFDERVPKAAREEVVRDPGTDLAESSGRDERSGGGGEQGAGLSTMRKRLRGVDSKAGGSGVGGQELRGSVRVDASLQSLVQRHRELQEGLTDEMVVLSRQLKEGSLAMDIALHETDKVLDSTEDAIESSLASTNRANLRMGHLSKQSWKTSCITWLILFAVFGMFLFMVVLIRIT